MGGQVLQWAGRTSPPADVGMPRSGAPGGAVREADAPRAFVDGFSAWLDQCWSSAKAWKDANVTPRLENCLLRRKGEYDARTKAQIAAAGGTGIYPNLTETKCAALAAWVIDVLTPADDRPWEALPTPVPDLPEEIQARVLDEVTAEFMPEYADAMLAAQQYPEQASDILGQLRERVMAGSREIAERYRVQLESEARQRAERMTEKVEDQLVEGGWHQAQLDLIDYLATYPFAVMAGPILETRRRLAWSAQTGTPEVVDEPIMTFRAVNPWDIYWAPNSRKIGDDWLFEVCHWNMRDLEVMTQSPGWVRGRVAEVVSEIVRAQSPPEPEHSGAGREVLEQRPQRREGPTNLIDARRWWGVVPGHLLLQWAYYNETTLEQFGFTDVVETRFYAVQAVQVNGRVVKVCPNLDPLGRAPYHATAFEKVPGSPIGKAVPEKMADCQDGYAGCLRAAVNNVAMASGPIVGYDTHACAYPIEQIAPWMVVPWDSSKSPNRMTPLIFHQVPLIASMCIQFAEYWSGESDNRTGIPKYIYGDQDVKGAAQTASGLSMLRNDAAKGVKRVLAFYDEDILRPVLRLLIDFNNRWATDPDLKGDVHVQARGALGALTRDTQQLRRGEFVQQALHPQLAQFITDEGWAYILRTMAERSDLPSAKVVKSDEEIRAYRQMVTMQQMANVTAFPGGGGGGAPAGTGLLSGVGRGRLAA